jgi:hypothetical protein
MIETFADLGTYLDVLIGEACQTVAAPCDHRPGRTRPALTAS